MQTEWWEKLIFVFNQVAWRTTASVTRPKYLARWPTFPFRPINILSILCKTWFLLFPILFLTTSHLELLQMPWVQERGSRRRRRRSARPRPRRKRSQRLEVGEERGGTAGSSRARSQLGREVVQAEHQPALQAAAGADALGRRWQRWDLADVAAFLYLFIFVFFKIRSGRLILIVGCGRAQRRTATFLLRQPGGGGGHLPVPARPGRGGREEGAEHRADWEDRPRGVWPLPCTDHRLCRQGEKKLTDWETPLNFARLNIFASVLVKCLFEIYVYRNIMFPNSISQAKASKFKGKPGNVQNSANKQQLNRLKKRHQYKSYSSLISLGTYLESRSGKKALSSHVFHLY